jgi:hypothetical protein
MISVKRLKEILEELPNDALAYAYEGEVVGIVFVSAEDKELGYIPTKDRGSDDSEFIRTTAA